LLIRHRGCKAHPDIDSTLGDGPRDRASRAGDEAHRHAAHEERSAHSTTQPINQALNGQSTKEGKMNNDRAFAVYAVALIGGAIIVLASLILAGIGELPAPLFILEHLTLALLFRGAYKSLDGPYGAFWRSDDETVAESASAISRTANAVS
jgi:hypothetical protein